MAVPPPILCSFVRGNELLVHNGRIYQPRKEDSDVYLTCDNSRTNLEQSEKAENLVKFYPIYFFEELKEQKKRFFSEIEEIKAKGLKEIEDILKDDAIKWFYLTEVQNAYVDSLDSSNEFRQLLEKAPEGKKAYADVLLWTEKRESALSDLEIPDNALIKDDKIYMLKRKILKSRKTAAVVHGREFFVAGEFDSLQGLEDRTREQFEVRLRNENSELEEAIAKVNRFRSAFASAIMNRGGFEYQNLGFGYCNGPIVYLKRASNKNEGVAVSLRIFLGNVGYSKDAFTVHFSDGKIIRTGGICLAHPSFYSLKWKLRSLPKGTALIRYLHNVRDRCWRGS